ncbi:choice-of-anchor I family protein [Pedobacter sp. SYSU D00535]|uniref:choice-of-anchor I family protein n=1 Tax=Pedobacter sp. SYSU D00535 TaxID=2810308 RepID=UPI001A96B998|nr:choice-of-anchor I family protein [Pedobacter sp. SYSU D00535]
MYKKLLLSILSISLFAAGCKKDSPQSEVPEPVVPENPSSFKEVASQKLGGEAASEISAFDPQSKRLFVVNNEGATKVEVLDLSNFPAVTKLQAIDFSASSGGANSVAVSEGRLAVALEGTTKTENGSVAIWNTSSLQEVRRVTVGALPDMVTFSPDGTYIVTANEGEPNADYSVDPNGSISIINTKNNYSVVTVDFTAFENSKNTLLTQGFRVYGKNATLAKDVEPEYVAISADSKKAWVTLQENNGVAEVDLVSGTIQRIIPLGVKDISLAANAFDVSDRDNKIQLGTWPIKAFYLPDAIAAFSANGTNYLALANEGDTREYTGFGEEVRVKDLSLDATRFPNTATLKTDANLGRLTVTRMQGDTDGDGDFDEIYSTGGRSVTILNATNGQLVAEVGKDLEERVIAAGKYDDTRSDNKGVEVEAVTVGSVNGKTLAFIGMERSDMIAIYDVSNPASPVFVQLFATGDAPEGVLFIKPKDSPNGRSILVVSSEGDGMVKFYQPDKL